MKYRIERLSNGWLLYVVRMAGNEERTGGRFAYTQKSDLFAKLNQLLVEDEAKEARRDAEACSGIHCCLEEGVGDEKENGGGARAVARETGRNH
jgi:hypothetical protein